MKKLIQFVIILNLISCGFTVELEPLEISGTSNLIPTSSPKGEIVGSATIENRECITKSYYLKSNKDGYFSIDAKGRVLLAKSNPPIGTHKLIIAGKCDSQESVITLNITIGPHIISTTPWLKQIGINTTASLGGEASAVERCFSSQVDSHGNIFCAGLTNSSLSETNGGSSDAFVMKLDPNGSILWLKQLGNISSTAMGGNATGIDSCSSIQLDSLGNSYCSGYTNSSLSEARSGGSDAFVMKLDPSGNVLWLRQLGAVSGPLIGATPSNHDYCLTLQLDSSGNIFCGGRTRSSLTEAIGGGDDAFVMKLDPNGNILWLRQLGAVSSLALGGSASGSERCDFLEVDTAGNSYCSGSTTSSLSELNGGSQDAFVMKLDPNGNILWLRQLGAVSALALGGSSLLNEICSAFDIDPLGNSYCSGHTSSSLIEANAGSQDAFVMKIDPSGNIMWVRHLGVTSSIALGGLTSGQDYCETIKIDSDGNSYCSGFVRSSVTDIQDGPGSEAFVMKLDPNGNILWLRQLGAVSSAAIGGEASRNEYCDSLLIDSSRNTYCVGRTGSSVTDTHSGSNDIFVMKLDPDGKI